ncbi:transposase [Flavobacterium sp. 1]|uniref:transposase n=1 Tax=Flavobacterium sp. 1 TaxID=2035200 RepID=UPI001E37D664|nr:transposase [Flavobacterium sp. 1]
MLVRVSIQFFPLLARAEISSKASASILLVHTKAILNYFDNRSANASAESFNAKIKAFRSQFTGVRNIDFFLFRLSNLFA